MLLFDAAAAAAERPAAFPSERLWSVELPSAPASPPVVAGRRVVVATLTGQVVARDLADGKEAWSADLLAVAPLAADDETVLVPVEGAVHALAAATGERRWSIVTPGITAPPLVKGGWVILAMGEGLTALSAADGDEIWTTPLAPVEQRPAIAGNLLFISLADGRLVALDLETAALRWEARIGANLTEPFPYGDRVYLGVEGTLFTSRKASDGSEEWTFKIGAAIRGTAAADAERIYTASMDNLLRAFDRGDGELKWWVDIGYRPLAGPILIGSRIAVPGRSATLSVFTTTGGKAEPLTLPDPAVTVPAAALATATEAVRANGALEETPTGPPVLAFVTGDPGKPWLLTLTGPPAPRLPAVTPLTALPGEALPPIALPGG